ncbi:rhodanese-like domain-containing protein [Polycladidibacter stylochi]|uniref:rhodanese-like domain-containing protein n=1 Tax=Polycladidibacter stylochi TaxID=1807766 RepID=UPI00082C7C4C|nr:rhodanese-like domain-containing protein [Pseudovibrio stylochi]
MVTSTSLDYAGEINVVDAFNALSNQDNAILVDVRTQAEWSFVGFPDLSLINQETLFVEWQSFPSGELNINFVQQLSQQIAQKELDQSASIYFLCRSGARSAAAAAAMTQQGFSKCFNITEGFEGPLDQHEHRGMSSGWKASGLPWKQN